MADDLRARLTAAYESAQMVGWDFSRLDGRLVVDDPGWDFEQMRLEALGSATSALDLGTGGGERLLSLCQRLGGVRPAQVVATEGWAPNVEVARRTLRPLGIEVVDCASEVGEALPFEAETFDLVMARHESYDPGEVARVLRPGGLLLTQQVDGRNAPELREWFGGEPVYPDVTLRHDAAAAAEAGLIVEGRGDWSGPMRFSDVQALVEYLALVPWEAADFTVATHLSTLTELKERHPITLTERRFWLSARRPLDGAARPGRPSGGG